MLSLIHPRVFGTVNSGVIKGLQAISRLPEAKAIASMKPDRIQQADAVRVIQIMQRKAAANNKAFESTAWTPRQIDKVLWAMHGK